VITQVFRGGWIADVDDARNFLDNFRSDSAANWTGYSDARFEALLDAADEAPTLVDRSAQLREAESRLLAAHTILPIYFYTSKHLVRPEVGGFEANALDRHPSRFLTLEPAR
jgi:oligopeptide transport system substrate-binding protein